MNELLKVISVSHTSTYNSYGYISLLQKSLHLFNYYVDLDGVNL